MPWSSKDAGRKWREANREKARAAARAWREANPEKVKAMKRKWYLENREYCIAKAKEHREANPRSSNRVPIVYIFRNEEGEVIYVGRGTKYRLSDHKKYTEWWNEVVDVRTRRCKTWADSLVLEALFIRKYQPKYNKVGVIK